MWGAAQGFFREEAVKGERGAGSRERRVPTLGSGVEPRASEQSVDCADGPINEFFQKL
jgi:hypothetical protein